jgi:hypothetical protein
MTRLGTNIRVAGIERVFLGDQIAVIFLLSLVRPSSFFFFFLSECKYVRVRYGLDVKEKGKKVVRGVTESIE